MRVLHLATTYPLHGEDSNAAFVQSIAEGLAARGHEVEVLVPWHPDLVLERPGSGVRLRAFRYSPTRRWHPWGYAQALTADRSLRADAYLAAVPAAASSWSVIRRRLRQERWDLLHAHWLLPNAPVMAAARGGDGPPLVISCHGSGVFLAERFGWAGALARYALRRCAALTACSADLAGRLRELGAGVGCGPAAERIPYGVDTERFRPLDTRERSAARAALAARHEVPVDAPWIGAVGRLVYKKGFEVLIDALPAIAEKAPAVQCLIAGSGPLRQQLVERARALGVADRLHLIGPLAHADVPQLYAALDVVAVPSVHGPGGNVDGLPNTLMEALASGTPVIASRVAGIPDVVRDGDNGLLFGEGDPAGLAAGASRLLGDPETAGRIGADARRDAVAELRWERTVERFEAVYARSIDGSEAGRS